MTFKMVRFVSYSILTPIMLMVEGVLIHDRDWISALIYAIASTVASIGWLNSYKNL